MNENEYDTIKELLEPLVAYEPYPVSIFPDLTNAQWASIEDWCDGQGFSLDRLSGNYGRLLTRRYHEAIQQVLTLVEQWHTESK